MLLLEHELVLDVCNIACSRTVPVASSDSLGASTICFNLGQLFGLELLLRGNLLM